MNIKELIRADFKNIFRDPTLIGASVAPFLILLVVLFGVPFVTDFIFQRWEFDLTPYHYIIQVFFVLISALVYSIISAFIILDERDESILSFIKITPMGIDGYLKYRIGFALISTAFASILIAGTLCIRGYFSLFDTLLLCTMVPLESIILTMLVVTYAANKVEGLAIAKMLGLIPFAVLAPFFISSGFRYFLFFLPPFWVGEVLITESNVIRILLLGGAIVIHLLYIHLLKKKFMRRVLT